MSISLFFTGCQNPVEETPLTPMELYQEYSSGIEGGTKRIFSLDLENEVRPSTYEGTAIETIQYCNYLIQDKGYTVVAFSEDPALDTTLVSNNKRVRFIQLSDNSYKMLHGIYT